MLNTYPSPEDPDNQDKKQEIKINKLLGEEGGPI